MKICKVIGNVWATKKDENLNGTKLMIIKDYFDDTETSVAVDIVGAGIDDIVLVVSGSPARIAVGLDVDSAIVGVVDEIEIKGR